MFCRMGDWMQGSETLCLWSHQIRLRSDARLMIGGLWEVMHVLMQG